MEISEDKTPAPKVLSNKVSAVNFVSIGASWEVAGALRAIKETGYLIVPDTPGSDEYVSELLKNESIKKALKIEEEKLKAGGSGKALNVSTESSLHLLM